MARCGVELLCTLTDILPNPSSHVTQLQYLVVFEPVPRQSLEELILPASETLYHGLQEVLSRLAIVLVGTREARKQSFE